jgi:hypothetical protein
MPGFESNVIHGDFPGPLGPILINLCKKNRPKSSEISVCRAAPIFPRLFHLRRVRIKSHLRRALVRCRIDQAISYRLGGGETRTTLSPRTIIVPSFLVESELVTSSASSSTRFMCWSKLYNLPLTLRPPLSWTSTTLFRLSSKIFAATSDIQGSTGGK